MRKLIPLILLIVSGCTTTPNSSSREIQPLTEPGRLTVIDGKCCCILLPWLEGWTDCGHCIGWRGGGNASGVKGYHLVLVDAPIEWKESKSFKGPNIPHNTPYGWMQDRDQDGDVDLVDVALYNREFPYGVQQVTK